MGIAETAADWRPEMCDPAYFLVVAGSVVAAGTVGAAGRGSGVRQAVIHSGSYPENCYSLGAPLLVVLLKFPLELIGSCGCGSELQRQLVFCCNDVPCPEGSGSFLPEAPD